VLALGNPCQFDAAQPEMIAFSGAEPLLQAT
jgi:hypothetical protein